MNRFTPKATSRVATLILIAAIMALSNTAAYAQAKGKKMPPPPPTTVDPLVRIEKAIDGLDNRLKSVEADVKILKDKEAARAATEKDAAAAKVDADKKAKAEKKELNTRVAKVESRLTTLENRPPLTRKEYVKVYVSEPPVYIYAREPGSLTRRCYTYVDMELHIFDDSKTVWLKVTK